MCRDVMKSEGPGTGCFSSHVCGGPGTRPAITWPGFSPAPLSMTEEEAGRCKLFCLGFPSAKQGWSRYCHRGPL